MENLVGLGSAFHVSDHGTAAIGSERLGVMHSSLGRTWKQMRLSFHADCFAAVQDMRGGLQVLSPNGNYIDATPIEDAIVVNAGDLLARWSNDTIKSTKHRVVEPPSTADVHPARYSIAYFCNPNFDRFIDAIPSTYDASRPKKYEGINRLVCHSTTPRCVCAVHRTDSL